MKSGDLNIDFPERKRNNIEPACRITDSPFTIHVSRIHDFKIEIIASSSLINSASVSNPLVLNRSTPF
jgi:hypothetical protein